MGPAPARARLTAPALRAAAALLTLGWMMAAASPAAAQATSVPAGPKFLFILANNSEDHNGDAGSPVYGGMTYPWLGVGTERYLVVKDAIRQVAMNAPIEVEIGAIKTYQNGPAPLLTFNQLAPLDSTRGELIESLESWTPPQSATTERDLTWAETYSYLIDQYLTQGGTGDDDEGWERSPFDNDCSELHVIVIGANYAHSDNNYITTYTGTYAGDYKFPTGTDTRTRLDNVANYVYSTGVVASDGSTRTVYTHTILVDATTATSQARSLYNQTAIAGGGLYYEANQEHEVGLAIWQIITNAYDGMITRSGPVVSTSLDYLFQGYFEIVPSNPLFQGHLRYYALEDDPEDPDFGQVLTGGGTDGSLWDAGEILASRYAVHAEVNTDYADLSVFDYNNPRAIFTNYEDSGFPHDSAPAELLPFDRTSTDSSDTDGDGTYTGATDVRGPLVDLLVPVEPTDYTDCDAMDYDVDADCDVDPDDAQLIVDFLRGVNPLQDPSNLSASSFGKNLSLRRDTWKLGSVNHSVMAYAPSDPQILTSKPDFYNFLTRIGNLSSMIYVTSNDGMLHAFNVPDEPSSDPDSPNGGWEWWAYIPRHILSYDYESVWGERENRAIEQKFSGETFTNDGYVNLEYVWMDGVCNHLADEDGDDGCSDVSADGIAAESGAEWHRILVASMGQASRHVFSLDVCDPGHPLFLWEVPGGDDGEDDYDDNPAAYTAWGRGRTMSRPTVGVVYDASGVTTVQRWVAFWGSGIPFDNAETRGAKYHVHPNLYMVDVLDPFGTDPTSATDEGVIDERGFPIPVETSNLALTVNPDLDDDPLVEYYPNEVAGISGTPAALFGSPAAVDVDGDGGLDIVYIGDRSGFLYKYLLNSQDLNSPTSCIFTQPYTLAVPLVEQDTHDIYYRPAVTFDLDGTLKVFYGSGSPLSLNNYQTPGQMYFFEDQTPLGCSAGVPACTENESLVDGVRTLDDGEKLVGNPVIAAGVLYFTTYVGDSDPCEVGDGRLWGLSIVDCSGALQDVDDFDGDSVTLEENVTIEGIPSEVTFANDSIYVSTTTPGAAPEVLDPIRVAPTGNEMTRHSFSNWRNIF